MPVLDQPFFDADGGVCRNDIIDLSFKSCPVLLNTLAMITHGNYALWRSHNPKSKVNIVLDQPFDADGRCMQESLRYQYY